MPRTSAEVRAELARALPLDLVGPEPESVHERETLTQAPSRWYLTGFLVPFEASEEQLFDPEGTEDVGVAGEGGDDDDDGDEPSSTRRAPFPSSLGISVLVPPGTKELEVVARWGDYTSNADGTRWAREPREEVIRLELGKRKKNHPLGETGLSVVTSARTVPTGVRTLVPKGTRAVSVFLVNHREPKPDALKDEAFAFQATLEVRCAEGLCPRPNVVGSRRSDPDERIADLQYRDVAEHAVGHGVATRVHLDPDGRCRRVATTWIPSAEVEKVVPGEVGDDVTLAMEVLAGAASAEALRAMLIALPGAYAGWITQQRDIVATIGDRDRREVGAELLRRAEQVCSRIERGIELLGEDPLVLEAFRIANRAMARQARQRSPHYDAKGERPSWRPFQLAFLLLNLRSIAQPTSDDRETVDLLFFPTGGGKTEAYLGLAAFTLILRGLRREGIASAGVAVLMRYTLRLLTLDQLERAAALICALELERQADVARLGSWPFEIGLWVGRAATPNRIGKKGDDDRHSARAKLRAFQNDDRKNPSPIPLETCPWCRTKFTPRSFRLVARGRPNEDHPTDLRVGCANRHCDFASARNVSLPIVTVDEAIYRRLPCFLIATVDKFAALPWVGQAGMLLGKAERHDEEGFYGPADPGRGRRLPDDLVPPELVIQDELHLISGPLGTISGLYEAAIDALAARTIDGKAVRPKVVASTATVRRAEAQIRALFARSPVEVFPPPGPDVRDSFFARTVSPKQKHARLYLGVAAQGRSTKVILLRTYLALMGAAQRAWVEGGGASDTNPADPYMTLVGYFGSLRELGGSRRIVEDEVNHRLPGYGARLRDGERRGQGSFAGRRIAFEVPELTSRESTAKVAETKRRLALPFAHDEHVDVALATNMISVGLDITRLGLMVVLGQPKTAAEYIQSTSRVGRDENRPGLVVTLLNVHRPRDRSHYERFEAFHESFYRSVEATSVTPFAPRAIDRALAAVVVSMARHGHPELTPPTGATEASTQRAKLGSIADAMAERLARASDGTPEDTARRRASVRMRTMDLLDQWAKIAHSLGRAGEQLEYAREQGGARSLLHDPLDPELDELPAEWRKFRAGRSMRNVEPQVNVFVKTLDDVLVDVEEGL